MPTISAKRGNLDEHDPWNRHNLAYNMGLWDFSYTYAVLTLPIDQTIDGEKSFLNFPICPVNFPTEDAQAANKVYVDYASVAAVTFENMYSNGDVGPGANQVARGDHTHSTLPTQDQKDAMDSAQDPDSSNPFIVWDQFSDHSLRHENNGPDEISVAGLSGELADLQNPKDHTHQSSGSGVGGQLDHGLALTGLLDNDHPQYPLANVINAPTGVEDRTDSTVDFNQTSRIFTIAPAVTSFDIWQQGTKYTISSSDPITLPDTSGTHVIYYDAGTLTYMTNPSHAQMDDIIVNKVFVGIVYYNATSNVSVIRADERHGVIMSGKTHEYLHDAVGSLYVSGFEVTDYILDTDSDAALTFEVSNGEFYDEDLELDIIDGTPSNQYEQQLNGGDASIPVMYRDDIDGSWIEDSPTTLPYKTAGSGRLAYNNDDLDNTFSQVELSNNTFMGVTLVATNDWQYPIKMIQGQNQYSDKQTAIEDANSEILSLGNLPSPEMIVLYRFVMHSRNVFGGTKQAEIVAVTDFRGSGVSGSSASAQSHGALGGLSNDDHMQYVLVDGTRSITGPLYMSGDITPSQITASQDDYNPTNLSTSFTLRLSSDASWNITGLQGGADGRLLTIFNVGSNNIVLKNEDASSSTANRFALTGDKTLTANSGILLQYDSTSLRWRAVSL